MATAVRKLRASGNAYLAILVLLAVTIIVGCGGDAGVDNGSITGTVFSDVQPDGGGAAREANVAVVAVREDDPGVIRTAQTNPLGQYVINDVPTAKYTIGYSKRGFRTIDTKAGATQNRTAVGDQIRIFVEPGGVALAPDVTLTRLSENGFGTVIIKVIDKTTGGPILHANIRAGAVVSDQPGSDGRYTLLVPVQFPVGSAFGTTPGSQNVRVSAEGYADSENNQLIVPPGETSEVSIQLTPREAGLDGTIQITKFQDLFDRSQVKIDIVDLPQTTRGSVTNDGRFLIAVPSSNAFETRQLSLVFSHPGLKQARLTNIVVPLAGKTLSRVVEMEPKVVTLVGSVVDSAGGAPTSIGPVADTVTVRETGQQAILIDGSFQIPGVPTGADQAQNLNLDVRIFRKAAGKLTQESGQATVKPLTDTIFQVPLIKTAAGA